MSRPSLEQRFYPEVRFGGFTHVDGTIAFHLRIESLLEPSFVVLDVGCGRGAYADDSVPLRRRLRSYRGRCRRVLGIDVDPAASSNPFVDEFRLIPDDGHWPVEDASIDLALADFVLEHVTDPDRFFSEARRVIRPGGFLCARTTNRRGYVALASRLVPERWHRRILGAAQPDRQAVDVFPAVYHANTRPVLRSLLDSHGFEGDVFGIESEPSYLGFSAVTYALGVLHQRLAPQGLRVTLCAFATRREG